MTDTKTKAANPSVADALAAIDAPARRADCDALVALMTRATGEPPVMWGAGIIGFGTYHYRYDSGPEGDSCLVGFSSRKSDISVYLAPDLPNRDEHLAHLGRHKAGKGCVYVRCLSDIDVTVLEALVMASVTELRSRYPGSA
jgi:hypothetical protein